MYVYTMKIGMLRVLYSLNEVSSKIQCNVKLKTIWFVSIIQARLNDKVSYHRFTQIFIQSPKSFICV
mgnify:CR=1 FL=1